MYCCDLLTDKEFLPRVTLLKEHLALLDIDLTIHTELPDEVSPRLIVVPALAEMAGWPEETEVIAIYLDVHAHRTLGALELDLHTWPARSSDREVERLAAYLKSPLKTAFDIDEASANRTQRRQRDRNTNIAAFFFVSGVVLVLILIINLSDSATQSEEPTDLASEQVELETTYQPKAEQQGEDDSGSGEQPSTDGNSDRAGAHQPGKSNPHVNFLKDVDLTEEQCVALTLQF